MFRDPDALNDLVSAGVDRAELSLLSQEGLLDGNLAKTYRNTRTAEDDPAAPRQAVYADTDVRQGRTLVTSMASVIAAFAASGVVVLTGGAALAAIGTALAAAGGVGSRPGPTWRRCRPARRCRRPTTRRGPASVRRA